MTCWAAGVAGRRRGGDILTAHGLGVATGQPDHLAQPSGQSGLAGQHAEPGARGEALPAAAPPAGARGAGRVHHHVADLPREAGRTDLDPPVDDEAAPDARPEGDHDDVVVTHRGADAVLGQHGEVGVVLDQHGPAGQLVADQLVPVHALGLREVRGEAEPAPAVHHAGRPHAHGHRAGHGGPGRSAPSFWSRSATTRATASAT